MDVTEQINAIYSSQLSSTHKPYQASRQNPEPELDLSENYSFLSIICLATMLLTACYIVYASCIRKIHPVNLEYTAENVPPGQEYWHKAQPPSPKIVTPRTEKSFDLFGRVHDTEPIVPLPEVPQEPAPTKTDITFDVLMTLFFTVWEIAVLLLSLALKPVRLLYSVATTLLTAFGTTISDLHRWYFYEWELRNIVRIWWRERTAFLYTFQFWAIVVAIYFIWIPVKHTVSSVQREWNVRPLPYHTPVPVHYWGSGTKDEPVELPWFRWTPRIEKATFGNEVVREDGAKTSIGEVERLITVIETMVQTHIETLTQTERVTETIAQERTIFTPKVETVTVFQKETKQRPDGKASWPRSLAEKPETEKRDGWWYCDSCRQKHCCEFC